MSATSFICETRWVGKALEVRAFDPATLVEVSFQAPPMCDFAEIEEVAAKKLRYALARRRDLRRQSEVIENGGEGILV